MKRRNFIRSIFALGGAAVVGKKAVAEKKPSEEPEEWFVPLGRTADEREYLNNGRKLVEPDDRPFLASPDYPRGNSESCTNSTLWVRKAEYELLIKPPGVNLLYFFELAADVPADIENLGGNAVAAAQIQLLAPWEQDMPIDIAEYYRDSLGGGYDGFMGFYIVEVSEPHIAAVYFNYRIARTSHGEGTAYIRDVRLDTALRYERDDLIIGTGNHLDRWGEFFSDRCMQHPMETDADYRERLLKQWEDIGKK